jgi:hypothetical protein
LKSYEEKHWENVENQRAFMVSIASVLGVNHLDDWYNVSPTSITKRGGSKLLQLYRGSLENALRSIFPEYL